MKLAALQDTLQTVNDYGHFLHQRFHAEEWKEDPYTCIDVYCFKDLERPTEGSKIVWSK